MFAFGDKKWPGLAKLNEESGELVQVIGKLMMTHGRAEHWDGSDLRARLVEGMADAVVGVDFVAFHALTAEERNALRRRIREKLALFEQWHEEQAEP
jgi:hypothetical protein